MKDADVDILLKHKNFIDCQVGGRIEEFFITWIYGDPTSSNRASNWKQLIGIGRNRRLPWKCVGDFNDISNHGEKI